MRYAILSDIHSNLEALTAVLESLSSESIDRYLCLGDVIGYGVDPSACLERIQACNALLVLGNHEAGCMGKLSLDLFTYAARKSLEWTRERLSFMDLNTLRSWPLIQTEDPCTLVHATLSHPDRFEYLVDMGQAADMLERTRTRFVFAGHTHMPLVVEYDSSRHKLMRVITEPQAMAKVDIDVHESIRYLVNPGSVGQPRDGDPRASFAIMDTEARSIQVRRVAYDVAAVAHKIREAGLPNFLADRLAVGR